MTLTSAIAKESRLNRVFRRVALIALPIVLVVLILTPGFMA